MAFFRSYRSFPPILSEPPGSAIAAPGASNAIPYRGKTPDDQTLNIFFTYLSARNIVAISEVLNEYPNPRCKVAHARL